MIKANVSAGAIFGHLLWWVLIIVVTGGIGLLFFPYSCAKFILNRTVIDVDGESRTFVCEFDFTHLIGHFVIWFFICILTAGIGYFFYIYKVWNYALSHTSVKKL